MKRRNPVALALCLVLAAALPAAAQNAAPAPAPVPAPAAASPAAQSAEAEGARYAVRSEAGEADAKALARDLDLRFAFFNAFFRFDPAKAPGKLKVAAFSKKDAYDAYVKAALGETRDGACYLHYAKAERRELVVLRTAADGRAFAHQAFVQYLRAFVPGAPSWMREGFAAFFETLEYDAAKDQLAFDENLGWLETVRAWGPDAPAPSAVLAADLTNGIAADKLTPAAWGLVSFLTNSTDENYRRFLYEAFLLLNPEATAAENSKVLLERVAAWTDAKKAEEDYAAYIKARKTFNELVDEGKKRWTAKEADAAAKAFAAAAELKPRHYAPRYYLGLLAYERRDYAAAEAEYKLALSLGAEEALVDYALGVAAAAEGKSADAKAYLEKAKALAPAKYGAKADELLGRLK